METPTFEATFRESVLGADRPMRLEAGQHVTVTTCSAPVASRWDFSRLAAAASADEQALASLGLDAWTAMLDAEDAA